MLYFPDTRESLYQLRPWYDPLRALHARHPIVCVFQDSRTAAVVRDELGLPTITIARYGALDGLLSRSDVKLCLYVNHTPQNFSTLRFTSLAHVYLTHGDSDKGVSVSNQAKAYDFCFVAGQAAVDRMAGRLMFTDPAQWCVPIGRPPLDSGPDTTKGSDRPDRPTVLYAPTWEGAQPSVSYSSVVSHGPRLTRALIEAGYVVVYRPHPLTGVTNPAYGVADAQIREILEQAQAEAPTLGHQVQTSGTLLDCFVGSDFLVSDISAVAIDWLAAGKPLAVTVPSSPDVLTSGTTLLDVVPRLAVSDLGDVARLVREQVSSDPARDERRALTEYYLGDCSPGRATERFLDACTKVIAERDDQWSTIVRRGGSAR